MRPDLVFGSPGVSCRIDRALRCAGDAQDAAASRGAPDEGVCAVTTLSPKFTEMNPIEDALKEDSEKIA